MASVFWDGGSSSNFVKESYAKQCGFKGRPESLAVVTLGGVEKDYHTVTTYTCFLRSLDGQLRKFEAYGMESITGAMSRINRDVIRRLFPNLDDKTLASLRRADNVDVLIA